MNTQSIDISLYQKGDISLERIYGKYRNSFIRSLIPQHYYKLNFLST